MEDSRRDHDPARAAVLAVLALALYIPMGYVLDSFLYRRALRRQQQQGAAERGARAGRERARRGG
jgi:hypothetical protein